MSKRIIQIIAIVLLCALTMQFLTGCPGHQTHADIVVGAHKQKLEELVNSGMTKEEAEKWLDEHREEWHPDYKKNDDAEKSTKGHWELVDKYTDPNKDIIANSSKMLFTVNQTSHTLKYSYDDEEDVMNGTHFRGTYSITCNDLPQSYKVGDTITITTKAEAHSVTDKKHYQGFIGYAKFEACYAFKGVGFKEGDTEKVAAGMNREENSGVFHGRQEHTYEKVLDEKFAGLLEYFNIILITDAGESVWKYEWVADK